MCMTMKGKVLSVNKNKATVMLSTGVEKECVANMPVKVGEKVDVFQNIILKS